MATRCHDLNVTITNTCNMLIISSAVILLGGESDIVATIGKRESWKYLFQQSAKWTMPFQERVKIRPRPPWHKIDRINSNLQQ
mmetsp:Transcript_14662/g.29929  ORF Transcript_14662/g.29929 Transcript_14662/m.29929 type:complete len:83 (-) Transcript_14662:77-325(-)